MASLALPIISGIGSLFGGLFGSSSATRAAQIQANAALQAAQMEQGEFNQSLNFEQGIYNNTQSNLNPYISAGTNSLNTLQSLMPSLTTPYQSFQAPTGVNFTNDPAYQFDLTQGIQALNNSAAARGGLLSGGTAEALSNYVQGNALNAYQTVYGNALNTYNTNAGNYYTGQANTFNRYGTLANSGQTAAAQLGQAGATAAGQVGNTLAQIAQAQSAGINNAAAANASGVIGSSNALTAGIQGGLNSASNAYTLSQILPMLQAGNGGGGSGYNTSGPYSYGYPQGPYNPNYDPNANSYASQVNT